MSQSNLGTIVPSSTSGTQLANYLSSFEDALLTSHSGTSRPSYADTGTIWADNTSVNLVFNVFDDADDVPVFQVDATNNVARVAMDADGDSYIVASTDDRITLVVGGSEKARFDTNGLTLNSNGANELVINDANSITPAGAVSTFAMTTPPAGWLECDGSAISRTTYATLFAAIGTTFGAGDGSTTFGIPDLRGEFVRGWDNSRGVDSARAFGSAQADEIEAHTHTIDGEGQQVLAGGANSAVTFTGTDAANTGSTGGSETRPRNIALMYCIKT
jgi:microcystin-dependent protein